MRLDAYILWSIIVGAVCVVSWVVARMVRANATRLNLIQSPNDRSSHVHPTPSGGGIGIAIASSGAGLWVASQTGPAGWVVLVATCCIAVLGFLDDIYDLSSRLRFGLQIILVAVVLIFIGEMPTIALFGLTVPPLLFYPFVLVVGVWWINLFNFMDGIDGLAASQSIIVLVAACMMMAFLAPDAINRPMWWWGLAVAAASLGFLAQNWPPARVFMGDAGSNYLALVILGVSLYTISQGWLSYTAWIILIALFVTDASITLVRRIILGERWFSAHRQHAYQRLSRKWRSHKRVTLLYGGISLLWLVPLAFCSAVRPDLSWLAVLLAYLPLVLGVMTVGAGRETEPP